MFVLYTEAMGLFTVFHFFILSKSMFWWGYKKLLRGGVSKTKLVYLHRSMCRCVPYPNSRLAAVEYHMSPLFYFGCDCFGFLVLRRR